MGLGEVVAQHSEENYLAELQYYHDKVWQDEAITNYRLLIDTLTDERKVLYGNIDVVKSIQDVVNILNWLSSYTEWLDMDGECSEVSFESSLSTALWVCIRNDLSNEFITVKLLFRYMQSLDTLFGINPSDEIFDYLEQTGKFPELLKLIESSTIGISDAIERELKARNMIVCEDMFDKYYLNYMNSQVNNANIYTKDAFYPLAIGDDCELLHGLIKHNRGLAMEFVEQKELSYELDITYRDLLQMKPISLEEFKRESTKIAPF